MSGILTNVTSLFCFIDENILVCDCKADVVDDPV